MSNPELESGIIKLPSGRAKIRMDDGTEFTLRRPKVGEYRVLREHVNSAPDTRVKDDNGDPVMDGARPKRVEGAEGLAIAHQVGWWRLVGNLGLSGDEKLHGRSLVVEGHLPDNDDDFDYWMVAGTAQVALFGHWGAAPLDLSR